MIIFSRSLACDIANEAGYRTLSRMATLLVYMILETAKLTKRTAIRLGWRDQILMAAIALGRNPTAVDYIVRNLACSNADASDAIYNVARATSPKLMRRKSCLFA